MKSKRYLYGLMGLLSLLGFIGIFTEAKSFLGFFAFAVDFEYFFIKSDEMLEEYMNKSASRAFYCGMISVALDLKLSSSLLPPGRLPSISESGWDGTGCASVPSMPTTDT